MELIRSLTWILKSLISILIITEQVCINGSALLSEPECFMSKKKTSPVSGRSFQMINHRVLIYENSKRREHVHLHLSKRSDKPSISTMRSEATAKNSDFTT